MDRDFLATLSGIQAFCFSQVSGARVVISFAVLSTYTSTNISDAVLMVSDISETVQLLPGVDDVYGGVMVDMSTPMDVASFVSSLTASIEQWKKHGKKGVWIKLPIDLVHLVQPAVQNFPDPDIDLENQVSGMNLNSAFIVEMSLKRINLKKVACSILTDHAAVFAPIKSAHHRPSASRPPRRGSSSNRRGHLCTNTSSNDCQPTLAYFSPTPPQTLHALAIHLIAEGFWYHHAESNYLMLVYWIPETAHTLPVNATHRVYVGAIVMNAKGEMLVVKEKSGRFGGTGIWKIPIGAADEGEDISAGAIREVKEETGIDAEFLEVLAFRFCVLITAGNSANRQESEIEAAQWMPLDEFAAQPTVQKDELLKHIPDICLAKASGKGYTGFVPVLAKSFFSGQQKCSWYLNRRDLNQPSNSDNGS
ncbi:hypothetical protein ACLOJK_035206 [Asimina triloba]